MIYAAMRPLMLPFDIACFSFRWYCFLFATLMISCWYAAISPFSFVIIYFLSFCRLFSDISFFAAYFRFRFRWCRHAAADADYFAAIFCWFSFRFSLSFWRWWCRYVIAATSLLRVSPPWCRDTMAICQAARVFLSFDAVFERYAAFFRYHHAFRFRYDFLRCFSLWCPAAYYAISFDFDADEFSFISLAFIDIDLLMLMPSAFHFHCFSPFADFSLFRRHWLMLIFIIAPRLSFSLLSAAIDAMISPFSLLFILLRCRLTTSHANSLLAYATPFFFLFTSFHDSAARTNHGNEELLCAVYAMAFVDAIGGIRCIRHVIHTICWLCCLLDADYAAISLAIFFFFDAVSAFRYYCWYFIRHTLLMLIIIMPCCCCHADYFFRFLSLFISPFFFAIFRLMLIRWFSLSSLIYAFAFFFHWCRHYFAADFR